MGEVNEVAESGQETTETGALTNPRNRIIAAIFLSISFISLVFLLNFAETFKENCYQVGVGARYPQWNSLSPSSADSEYEHYASQCDGVELGNVLCALVAKFKTGHRYANELATIRRATATDRSTSYCDDFFGPCRKQQANITFSDAKKIFTYLDFAYLQKAREDANRGRLSLAKDSIARIGYLLGPLDLPLGSEYCCQDWTMLYIAPAFLSDKESWRNRKYVEAVFSLTDSSWEQQNHGSTTGFNDIDTYTHGINSAEKGCYRTAGRAFASLALSDRRQSLRELAAYLALRSRLSEHINMGRQECKYPQPSPITETESNDLRKLVKRMGFVSDVEQMDVALAERRPNGNTK